MTPREELEALRRMAELETKAASVSPPSGPTAGEASARGAAQGFTLGAGPQITGLIQATAGADAPWYMRSPLSVLAELTSDVPADMQQRAREVDAEKRAAQSPGERLRLKVEEYRQGRDSERRSNAAAREAHPGVYTASEIGAAIPTAFLLPGSGARGAAGLAKTGGTIGAIQGAVAGPADLTKGDVGGVLLDALKGGAMGAATGGAFGALGNLATRAGEGIRKATADAGQMAAGKADQALRAARSALGGEVAAAFKAIEKAEEIAANTAGRYTAQQVAQAQAWLASPEVQALARNAAENLLAAGPGRVAGSLQSARNVLTDAQQKATPQAIDAAADAMLANPIATQVVPRLKNYASRAIPPAVGGVLGGPAGALAGFGAGAVLGNPGTALANMLKHPATRNMGWRLLQLLGKGGETAGRTVGLPAERALMNEEMNAP